MSSFTKPLIVKVLDNGKHYEVQEYFTYYMPTNKDKVIKVPTGFITDFASVPRIFWSVFPPFGKYTKCAVLHDRLCVAFLEKDLWYNMLENPDKALHNHFVRRYEADKIFLESMKAIKVDFFTRWCLYLSVRLYAVCKYGYSA